MAKVFNGKGASMSILFDSGADVDLISEQAALQFRDKWETLRDRKEETWELTTANGSSTKIEHVLELAVVVADKLLGNVPFYIVRGLRWTDVILGNPTLAKFGTKIDWSNRTFSKSASRVSGKNTRANTGDTRS